MEFDKCPLTGWELANEPLNPDQFENYKYFIVRYLNKEFSYLLSKSILQNKTLENNQYIFR